MNVNNGKTQPTSISRRKMLKAGLTAMPVVLTLQSGEALARSSNLISAAPGMRNIDGNALCLDTRTADLLSGGKYDLDTRDATVNAIPDVDYYLSRGFKGEPISADTFCELGGSRQYHAGGWHQVDLPTNGIIVSANALNSVSSRADILLNYLS